MGALKLYCQLLSLQNQDLQHELDDLVKTEDLVKNTLKRVDRTHAIVKSVKDTLNESLRKVAKSRSPLKNTTNETETRQRLVDCL